MRMSVFTEAHWLGLGPHSSIWQSQNVRSLPLACRIFSATFQPSLTLSANTVYVMKTVFILSLVYKVLPHALCSSQTALLASLALLLSFVSDALPHPFHNLGHSSRSSSSPWNLSSLKSSRLPLSPVQLSVMTSLWPDPQIHRSPSIIYRWKNPYVLHIIFLPLSPKCKSIFFSLIFLERKCVTEISGFPFHHFLWYL